MAADIKHEIDVHGNAVRFNDGVHVIYSPERAVIRMESYQYLYFPIPTPVIVDGQRLKAGKIWICFKTRGTSKIGHIRVFDPSAKKALFEKSKLNLTATDDHEVSFDFPRVPVNWGLNVTLGVESDSQEAEIDILSVGIGFY